MQDVLIGDNFFSHPELIRELALTYNDYRHSEDPGIMTVIIVCGTLAVFVGFRLADRLRRFIHQVPSTGLIDPPAHTYKKSVGK